jgi:cystathionine beta-synthase
VREEGIFCGGSSGSAVAGALKYIRHKNIGAGQRVVVLLPDSGSRYLSKVFNDDWMRENGYFSQPCADATVADVLSSKAPQPIIALSPGDRMMDVIKLMKEKGISQAPVFHDGRVVGIVREVDLLNHMLMVGGPHTADETIGDIVQANINTVSSTAPLDQLMRLFVSDSDVVLVTQPLEQTVSVTTDDLLGILTKIDVLDFVSRNCI